MILQLVDVDAEEAIILRDRSLDLVPDPWPIRGLIAN